ncbi:hypothetical protein JCM9279_005768 [Rhodotorula babjevae]
MPSSSDYGLELDYADTDLEAQLQAAETELPRSSSTAEVERAAQVDIALEQPQDDSQAAQQYGALSLEDALLVQAQARESLWDRFRKSRGWGALSVSDLTGPSWCEWQHSYRLLTKPHLPPLSRPATITTPSGATIAVDTARTVKREGVLDRGRAIHAKIEREVMGPVEEVKVEVQGKEEWWALRILNTAASVETLLETGRVREVPVVGWVGEFLVFGVCDEIERREVPPSPSSSTPTRRDIVQSSAAPKPPSPTTPMKEQQPTLKHFFSPVESPSRRAKGKERSGDIVDLTVEQDEGGSPAGPRWRFVLSDTKTRFNRSIPAEAESRAARLQLMLYHRLLLSFLRPSSPPSPSTSFHSAPAPFSWARLYAHHALDPSKPLSPAFLSSIAPLLVGTPTFAGAATLNDFVAVLGRYGELLGGDGWLADELEISYRLRGDEDEGGGSGRRKRWKGRRGAKKREREDGAERGSKRREEEVAVEPDPGRAAREADEEEDLRRAIELSLEDTAGSAYIDEGSGGTAGDESPQSAVVVVDEAGLDDSQPSFLANPSLPLPLSAPPASSTLDDDADVDDGAATSPLFGLADAFALPLNSQADPPAAPAPAGRYNLRRRPATARPPTSLPASTPQQPSTPPASPRPTSAPLGPLPPPPPPAPPTTPPLPVKLEPELVDPSFIGTTTFRNAPHELARWLASALSYWRSERLPIGVSPSETGRCRTCEFEDGCEWRAEKAREAAEGARRRREEREGRRMGSTT